MSAPKEKALQGRRRNALARKGTARGRRTGTSRVDDGATRTQILDAALKTFSVQGFVGASIADIARLYQLSPALIYHYFETKDELWRSSLEYGIGDVLRNLHKTLDALAEVDAVNRLKFFIRRYIAIMADRPEVFRVIIRESEARGPRLTWLSKHYLAPLYQLFAGLVDKAQDEGRIKAIVPSYHLSQIIAGACWQFIASRNRMLEAYGVDVLSIEEREQHTLAVIEVLFNGMLTNSSGAGS